MKRLLFISLLAVLALVAFTGGLIVYGAYHFGWETGLARGVANTLPIPAARFAGRSILLRDYFHTIDSLRTYLSSSDAKAQGIARELTKQDRQQALERLLAEEAINDLAQSRRVSVTNEEVEQAIQIEFNNTGKTTEQLAQYIHDTFGWSMDDFKTHLVRPILLERKMAASYASDHNNDLNSIQTYLAERLKKPDVVRYVQL